MATPNKTPNDSGRKSLIAHVWQIRRAVSKGSEKPRKDIWDKIDIIAKAVIAGLTVVAAIVIPLVVANIGGQVQQVVTTQNTGKDYMQIALNILEKKDLPQDMQKNVGLRKWAVDLLKYYSPVKLDDATTYKLINGETEIPFWGIIGIHQQVDKLSAIITESSPLSISRTRKTLTFVTPRGLLDIRPHSPSYEPLIINTSITSPTRLVSSP